MNNAIFKFDYPTNEPVRSYAPGTRDRKELSAALDSLSSKITEIPLIIGGKAVRTGNTATVVMPHNHAHTVAVYHKAGEQEVKNAIEAALEAHKQWASVSWVERLSITLKAAELLATKYRAQINAATMLGQSKNAYQAEIDAACETIDFLRFNASYVSDIYNQQPHSEAGIINRVEYRPLEGFVFAVTPFNFTAIASNLTMAPVVMGNVVIWKPASTSMLSNYILMQVFMEAGLPPGVVNFIPGDAAVVGKTVMAHKHFAGLHFTGSSATFNKLWRVASENLENYRSYPRIVGETGGKDFVMVHPSANPDEVATALVRGAFEYQGQKCSAASRAYIPHSLWGDILKKMTSMLSQITVGDVRQFNHFMNAVIDNSSFENIMGYISRAKESNQAKIIYGGTGDKSAGYFIQPTVIEALNPHYETMEEEIFGPVLTLYQYEDHQFDAMLEIVDNTSPYGLTGSIFALDRTALVEACKTLRYAAGNLYYNDKPTGAVVGQQPFGGSRQSGTNDKAGSLLNLLRWTSPRTIKENLTPPTDFRYPFMKEDKCS
ncbi:MAG TPA: L-glutamate gamma-semialdehyde dehydrogenase [Bacteroidales bacterium]|nr:L-glutamate gamma-semialdehyde dehydrogenase [Bacteroidales bacterium]